MQEIRLTGIDVDSGAMILADPSLLRANSPTGLYSTFRCMNGHYEVAWKVVDGPTGHGKLKVTSGQVWAVDPSYLPDLTGKQAEWASRDHLYGKFPCNGTITIHCPKNTGMVNLLVRLVKRHVKVD